MGGAGVTEVRFDVCFGPHATNQRSGIALELRRGSGKDVGQPYMRGYVALCGVTVRSGVTYVMGTICPFVGPATDKQGA
jgi:hypothetical protein